MSLGICIKAAEGVVLAAESRVTYTIGNAPVTFDSVTKLFSFSPPHNFIGVVTFGAAGIGSRTVQSFMPEFEASLERARLTVREYAERLSAFFGDHFDEWRTREPNTPVNETYFVLGGFDDGEPYGTTANFTIPSQRQPSIAFAGDNFGMRWGGQRDVVDRIVVGYDPGVLPVLQQALGLTKEQLDAAAKELELFAKPLPFDIFGLQDAVDLAILFIRTTIETQRLMAVQSRGCGGPIDVATITRQEGLKFVQRKMLRGEIP